MELITSIANAVVVAAVGFVVVRTINGRIDSLERRMDRHDAQEEARFGAIEGRFGRHEAQEEARFATIEGRLGRHEAQEEARFATIEGRLGRHEDQNESRFDALQRSIDGLRSDITQLAISLGRPPRAENA